MATIRRQAIALLVTLGLSAIALGQIRASWDPPVRPRPGAVGRPDRDKALLGVIGPDVILSKLGDIAKFGTVGGITAYSIETTSCNLGDMPAVWIDSGPAPNRHPLIGQNLYRYHDGRFDQIGMSWLKHSFCAVDEFDEATCGVCQADFDCDFLAIGCSDTYGTFLNGEQSGLGPRSEVNAATGAYPYPYVLNWLDSGDPIFKRLQVRNDDLDPALNPGAKYFMEGYYLTTDEQPWGTQYNNASYRECFVGTLTGGGYNLVYGAPDIQQMKTALHAWQDLDPGVMITTVDVPGDGRFYIGSRATDNGDGTWHYEWAVYNYNSDRAARRIDVPLSCAAASNIGFHDVDYHSDEPYSGADWTAMIADDVLTWSTDDEATDPDANAIRWNTMYSFRADGSMAPVMGDLTMTLFKAGSPATITVAAFVPGPNPCPGDIAGGNDAVDVSDLLALLAAWGPGPDPADITGSPQGCPDGQVSVTDLLMLLAQWGPCP